MLYFRGEVVSLAVGAKIKNKRLFGATQETGGTPGSQGDKYSLLPHTAEPPG